MSSINGIGWYSLSTSGHLCQSFEWGQIVAEKLPTDCRQQKANHLFVKQIRNQKNVLITHATKQLKTNLFTFAHFK